VSAEHWTTQFIGMAYDPAGAGPQAFNCWHFFRHVQGAGFGRDIPAMVLNAPLLVAMRQFRERPALLGWQRIDQPGAARDGDAVMLGHRAHPHHIGVFVADPPGVLHCVAGSGSVLNSLFHLELAGWRITGLYRPVDGER